MRDMDSDVNYFASKALKMIQWLLHLIINKP